MYMSKKRTNNDSRQSKESKINKAINVFTIVFLSILMVIILFYHACWYLSWTKWSQHIELAVVLRKDENLGRRNNKHSVTYYLLSNPDKRYVDSFTDFYLYKKIYVGDTIVVRVCDKWPYIVQMYDLTIQ